mmetsp:Transcript_8791/g.26291  ORF Transcript_8791/g.26291 Transcript_8791/m.26291 type:complete len:271 (-) Transcript_8791:765-1577(-)
MMSAPRQDKITKRHATSISRSLNRLIFENAPKSRYRRLSFILPAATECSSFLLWGQSTTRRDQTRGESVSALPASIYHIIASSKIRHVDHSSELLVSIFDPLRDALFLLAIVSSFSSFRCNMRLARTRKLIYCFFKCFAHQLNPHTYTLILRVAHDFNYSWVVKGTHTELKVKKGARTLSLLSQECICQNLHCHHEAYALLVLNFRLWSRFIGNNNQDSARKQSLTDVIQLLATLVSEYGNGILVDLTSARHIFIHQGLRARVSKVGFAE